MSYAKKKIKHLKYISYLMVDFLGIQKLRNKLAKLNTSFEMANLKIDTLSRTVKDQGSQINNQSQTIAAQDEAMHTAYYVIGTNKELKKNAIIKSGEILSDFNTALFTKIDVRKMTEFPIHQARLQPADLI